MNKKYFADTALSFVLLATLCTSNSGANDSALPAAKKVGSKEVSNTTNVGKSSVNATSISKPSTSTPSSSKTLTSTTSSSKPSTSTPSYSKPLDTKAQAPKESATKGATAQDIAKKANSTSQSSAKTISTTKRSTAKKTTAKVSSVRHVTRAWSPKTVSADGKPIWLDIKSARLAAKAQHKYIIADFYTSWCHWCKVLDKRTFHDVRVEKFLAKDYVCMKVDAQDNGAGQDLAMENEINGFPTVILFDPKGKRVGAIDGFIEAPEFIETFDALRHGKIPPPPPQ